MRILAFDHNFFHRTAPYASTSNSNYSRTVAAYHIRGIIKALDILYSKMPKGIRESVRLFSVRGSML